MGSAPAPRWDSVPDPAEGSTLGLPARDIVPCNLAHGVTLYKRQSLLSLIGTLREKFFRSFFCSTRDWLRGLRAKGHCPLQPNPRGYPVQKAKSAFAHWHIVRLMNLFLTWFYSGEHCSPPTNSNHRRR